MLSDSYLASSVVVGILDGASTGETAVLWGTSSEGCVASVATISSLASSTTGGASTAETGASPSGTSSGGCAALLLLGGWVGLS